MSVFISYAKPDLLHAERIYNELNHRDLEPWLDTECLMPGIEWEPEIKKAINNSDFVILLLSKKSINKRGFFQKEIRIALDTLQTIPFGNIYLLPVRLEECEPPELISKIQWVNLFPDWEIGLEKIIQAIQFQKSDSYYPSHLDMEIRKSVEISKFEKSKSTDGKYTYSLILEEFDGDESLCIFWNHDKEILQKYYRTYDGTRWFGPYKLNANEKDNIKRLLQMD